MQLMSGAGRGSEEYRWVAALGLLSLVATVGALLAGSFIAIPTRDIFLTYTVKICLLIPPTIILMAIVMTVRCALRREKSPFTQFKAFMADRFGTPGLTAGTVGPILLLPLLMGAFGNSGGGVDGGGHRRRRSYTRFAGAKRGSRAFFDKFGSTLT